MRSPFDSTHQEAGLQYSTFEALQLSPSPQQCPNFFFIKNGRHTIWTWSFQVADEIEGGYNFFFEFSPLSHLGP
jgi:hypothetical protein